MATNTPNFNLIKPAVNDPADQDLWGGYLNENMDIIDTALGSAGRLPVGSVFFTAVNTNPSSLLGYGTWVQRAQGRFIVGVGEGTDANSETRTYPQGEDSVGEYEHTLTVAEMPSHTHTGDFASVTNNQLSPPTINQGNTSAYLSQGSLNNTGGDGAHENSPPAFGLYVWERTA